jgi:ribosomal-protein-alanine N-acetyltransferase
VSDIETERLILRLVPLAGLAATAAGDVEASRRLIGAKLPDEWFHQAWVSELRLNQWKEDPDYAPWSVRAIAIRATGQIAGNINCHDKPQFFEHQGETGPVIELGYTVFPPFQRRGIAAEAITGLGAFAAHHGVRWIRLSIAPDNAPSLALARKFDARKIGTQYDDRDGPEDVYLFEIGQLETIL